MSYEVKQGNIFGRLGTGIGKGLGEQIPKEIERHRLSSGLKELGEKSGSPQLKQYAEFLSIPGVSGNPELVKQGTEFLKHQGQRESLRNRAGSNRASSNMREDALLQQAAALGEGRSAQLSSNRGEPQAQERVPQGNIPPGQPQIVEKNPLSPELQPAVPWSPEQRNEEISKVWDQNPYLTFPEASQIASDNERRYLESPEAYRRQQTALEETQEKVNSEIESQLRRKLHVPKGEEVWDKLSGESHNRIERGVARDLRKNPDANVKDLVNTWTDKALENGKTKSELKKLSGRNFDEKFFKKGENLEKLHSMSKSFKDFGNSEEFYNSLISDFDLSPEGASSIAFPLSKTANSYINKIKESNFSNYEKNARKYANEIGDHLARNDSILSIAKNIKEKDPLFDIKTFLSEVRSIQDELALSPLQKRELETRGVADIFPNWGDVFLFPRVGKGL